MDPGLSYRLESWQIFQDVYLGLLAKAHVTCGVGDCTKIIPALAQSLPVVNKTGTDFKFTLRKGLKYSNGEPVKASDFKYSIIRDFKLNSPGIGFYSNIAGVAACEANPTKCSDISGIIVDDKAGTVEIKLMSPQSDFEYILTTFFSSFVPSSTPNKDTENPPPPAAGPYYISSYKPSRSWVAQRNPHYKPIPGIPTGNPDKIVAILTDDLAQSAQYIESGAYNYDENLLPTDRLKDLQSKYGSQIKLWRTPSTYYFAMNQRTPPFDNLKARQAVNYAINRQTLVNLRGGLGVPTWNFLPPTYPQYKKITPTPYPYDLAKAKQLVQESGTAGMTVGVYTISDDTVDKAQGEYLAQQLGKIGWKTKLHELAGANYFVIIGNQATKAQIDVDRLVRGLPVPDRLVRRSRERRQHPPGAQQQQLERQLQGHERRDRPSRPPASGTGLLVEHDRCMGRPRQEAHGPVRERGAVPQRRAHVVLLVEDRSELRRLRRPVRRSGADVPQVTS